jgi:hypothetical protein
MRWRVTNEQIVRQDSQPPPLHSSIQLFGRKVTEDLHTRGAWVEAVSLRMDRVLKNRLSPRLDPLRTVTMHPKNV